MIETEPLITITFESNSEDVRRLKAFAQRQVIQGIPTFLAWQLYAAFCISRLSHLIPALKSTPWLPYVVGWLLLTSIPHARREFRRIRAAIVDQSMLQTVSLSGNNIDFQFADGRSLSVPVTALKVSATAHGLIIFTGWKSNQAIRAVLLAILIPSHAFSSQQEAGHFEYCILHSQQLAMAPKIPPVTLEGYPIAVTFQRERGDAAHAYYSGWSQYFVTQSHLRTRATIVIAPTVICLVIGTFAGAGPGIGFAVGIVISMLFFLASLLHLAIPAFPMRVAEQRRPIKQPLTVGLGAHGFAINDGSRTFNVPWNAVDRVGIDNRLIYLAMKGDLVMIPRTAFLDRTQSDEFFAAAETYRRGEVPLAAASPWPPPPNNQSLS